MATTAQIDANRQNAQASTGPRSDDGKARSRENALKHGLAGEVDKQSEAFITRRAAWAREKKPQGQAGEWALDGLVAATIQLDKCRAALDGVLAEQAARARMAWDLDRRVEAAQVAARLPRDPVVSARKLEASWHGCDMMIEVWIRLEEAVLANGKWTDPERSIALDLLAYPRDLRDGRTSLDAPEGTPPADHLRGLVEGQVERLEAMKESLVWLDDLERKHAEEGSIGLITKPAQLIQRYEREAHRRYEKAELELQKSSAPVPAPAPAPARPATRPVERTVRADSALTRMDEACSRALARPAPHAARSSQGVAYLDVAITPRQPTS
jgi:hypothetical protein